MQIEAKYIILCVPLGAVTLGIGTGCNDDDVDDPYPICLLPKGQCPSADSNDEVGDGDGDPHGGGDEEEYEGPMVVTHGELPIEVDGVALRLYGASYGHYY